MILLPNLSTRSFQSSLRIALPWTFAVVAFAAVASGREEPPGGFCSSGLCDAEPDDTSLLQVERPVSEGNASDRLVPKGNASAGFKGPVSSSANSSDLTIAKAVDDLLAAKSNKTKRVAILTQLQTLSDLRKLTKNKARAGHGIVTVIILDGFFALCVMGLTWLDGYEPRQDNDSWLKKPQPPAQTAVVGESPRPVRKSAPDPGPPAGIHPTGSRPPSGAHPPSRASYLSPGAPSVRPSASFEPMVPHQATPQQRTALPRLPSGEAAGSEAGSSHSPLPGPPPICPGLVLPSTEARFWIPMDSLFSFRLGTLDIEGTSGRILLHALVHEDNGRRTLALANVKCTDDPRMKISVNQRPNEPSVEMEVLSRTGNYGKLRVQDTRKDLGVLYCGGKAACRLEVVDLKEPRMFAVSPDGSQQLGSAIRITSGGVLGRGAVRDVMKIEVKPGQDAVLITACLLAMLLLKPWATGQQPPWSRSPTTPSVAGSL